MKRVLIRNIYFLKYTIVFILLLSISSCQNKSKTVENKYNFFKYEQDIDSSSQQIIPYCKILISEKFFNLLKGKKLKSIEKIKYALDSTITENLIIGVFIGGGVRKVAVNSERFSSDVSIYREVFHPDFYYYSFRNYSNLFWTTVPDIPKKILSYEIKQGVLYAQIHNYDSEENKTEIVSISPTNDSVFICNRFQKRWRFNNSDNFIDISFLGDSVNTKYYDISHQYFYEILERFIQEELGRRDSLYFENYLKELSYVK